MIAGPAPQALTPRIVAFLASEEGIVPEAYLDNAAPPVWTWGIGEAESGGNDVRRFKDKPQPIETCLRSAIALICRVYLPKVLAAFADADLAEHQLAAALSFVWRNGHLAGVQWVKDVLAGDLGRARLDFLNWTDHGNEIARCQRERDLFFDALWPPLAVPVSEVRKPSYRPHITHTIDALPILQSIMGGH